MPCSEEGCEQRALARGLCRTHYGRAYRNGEIDQHKPAGTARHLLSDLDPVAETAHCSACGERVSIVQHAKRATWRCAYSPDLGGRDRDAEKRDYGITGYQRKRLLHQHSECWVCGVSERLVIDHCHETGKIRGVLCNACNSGLGMFKDDQIRLRRAIKYLDDPPINQSPKSLVLAS